MSVSFKHFDSFATPTDQFLVDKRTKASFKLGSWLQNPWKIMRDQKFVLNKNCLALEHLRDKETAVFLLNEVLKFSCHIGSLVHKTQTSGLDESSFFVTFGVYFSSVIKMGWTCYTDHRNKPRNVLYFQRKRNKSQVTFKDCSTRSNNLDYDF